MSIPLMHRSHPTARVVAATTTSPLSLAGDTQSAASHSRRDVVIAWRRLFRFQHAEPTKRSAEYLSAARKR